MNNTLKILVGFLVWTLISVFVGWKVNTYYTGYEQNNTKEVTQVIQKELRDFQRLQAKELSSTLDDIKNQDFKVQKEKETIVNQPIYSTQCIDEAGLNLLKKNQEKYNELRKKSN